MDRFRRNLRALLASLLVYVVSLVLVVAVLPALRFSPARFAVMLFPIFPAIAAGLLIARTIVQLDELQQRIQLEAAAFSLVNTALLALALGLLQIDSPGGLNLNFGWIVFVAAAFWGLGLRLAQRRYR